MNMPFIELRSMKHLVTIFRTISLIVLSFFTINVFANHKPFRALTKSDLATNVEIKGALKRPSEIKSKASANDSASRLWVPKKLNHTTIKTYRFDRLKGTVKEQFARADREGQSILPPSSSPSHQVSDLKNTELKKPKTHLFDRSKGTVKAQYLESMRNEALVSANHLKETYKMLLETPDKLNRKKRFSRSKRLAMTKATLDLSITCSKKAKIEWAFQNEKKRAIAIDKNLKIELGKQR